MALPEASEVDAPHYQLSSKRQQIEQLACTIRRPPATAIKSTIDMLGRIAVLPDNFFCTHRSSYEAKRPIQPICSSCTRRWCTDSSRLPIKRHSCQSSNLPMTSYSWAQTDSKLTKLWTVQMTMMKDCLTEKAIRKTLMKRQY